MAHVATIGYQPVTNERPFLISNWIEQIQRRNSYRKTILELEKLSDRQLNDIGLLRTDLYNLVRQRIGL